MPFNQSTDVYELRERIKAIEHWLQAIKRISEVLPDPFQEYRGGISMTTNTLRHGYMHSVSEGERNLRDAALEMKEIFDIHAKPEPRHWWGW